MCRGYTKSCGLSVFLLFHLPYSQLFLIVDPMYLLRRDSLSLSLYVFCFFLFPKLSWLRNVDGFSEVKTDCVFLMTEVVFWWWIIVTDYSVTRSIVLKEPFGVWRSLWEVSSAKLFPTAVFWPVTGHCWINTYFILVHTDYCLFIPILCGWCVLMDVCHVIGFSLK